MPRASEADSKALTYVKRIPRPRLGYLGPPTFRVHAGLVEELLTTHPDWHFVTCGPVPGLKLPNLHDLGWVDSQEMSSVASCLDVGLMPYDCSQEMNLHCVPLKLFDYMASGKPIVATRQPGANRLLNEGRALMCDPTAESLAEAIGRACSHPAEAARIGSQARRYAEQHFGWDGFVEFIRGIYLEVMAHGQVREQLRGAQISPLNPRQLM